MRKKADIPEIPVSRAVDSGNGIDGAFIVKVDPQTLQETVICHGGYLGRWGYPIQIVFDRDGNLIVANEGCLLRINPNTCQQTVIRTACGAPGLFWGLALDHNGDILVAAETAILRIDPVSGEMQVVSSEGYFTHVFCIAVGKDNDLFVTNMRYDPACLGWVGEIIRVNRQNGRQTLISQGDYLTCLRGIVLDGDDIYVTSMATHDQNFGTGRVVHVDARSGEQRLVSEGGYLVCPVGIAVDADGSLIVADPYTINPESPDLYDGALIRIDPITGAQTLILRGHAPVLNHCGVAIVPDPASANKITLRK